MNNRDSEKTARVFLQVIEDNKCLAESDIFNVDISGVQFSSARMILINKVKAGYSIMYRESEFAKLNAELFVKSLENLLENTFSDSEIALYVIVSEYIVDAETISNIQAVTMMSNYIVTPDNTSYSDDELDYQDYEDEDDDSEDTDLDDVFQRLTGVHSSNLMNMYDASDFDDDSYNDSGMYNIGTSKSLIYAISPKRNYTRHGVLVVKNSSYIKKDMKTIKRFLKSFIPGNETWKRDLRKDLAKRWVNTMVITKKDLQQLQKDYKKATKKHASVNTGKAVETASRLLQTLHNNDHWNDPTK